MQSPSNVADQAILEAATDNPILCSSPKLDSVSLEEELPVTLQVVLGGCDGILIATDTKQMNVPRPQPWDTDHKNAVRSDQEGVIKVLFNAARTIACVCSGTDISREIGKRIIERVEALWDTSDALCSEAWSTLSENERDSALRFENTIIFVGSEKEEVIKIYFEENKARKETIRHLKQQKLCVLSGDIWNPASFILQKYYPTPTPPINALFFLAAHFISMGGELNPAGIGGLAMFFSKNGKPFEEV